jgi:SNF2 family DNA or RNA helicase
MENRVEEFRALVGHLRPDVADRVEAVDGLAGAAAFRLAVAPVYLRRNQIDVLAELPPRVETAEWLDFVGADLAAYRHAVAERQFMAMRRAAFVPGTTAGSAKLDRLVEIVDEALANGRKVVVFSYFLDVLDIVCGALGDTVVVGPLHGAVPPTERQALVDELTARQEPCVLVSQIESGGTGLNIQAASVVVLCEPQWKPSTEEQAIARCHRMGQVRPVDVHRLLVEDSVDERMVEVLARKARLVDEFVEKSDLKEAAPGAVDRSRLPDLERVASEAEEERRIIELERERLRVGAN